MTDETQGTPETTAASEPAATMTAPPHPFAPQPQATAEEAQVQGAGASAPASDDAPDETAPTESAPASDDTPDWETRFRELEQQLQSRQEQDSDLERQRAEYQQWQQAQAEAARRQQAEAAQRQWEELRSVARDRIAAANTDEEMDQIIDGLARQIASAAEQRRQQEVQRLRSEFDQTRQSDKAEAERVINDVLRPAYADRVMAEHEFPAELREQLKPVLLSFEDPNQMVPVVQFYKNQLAQSAPQTVQQVAASQAAQHRANNTFGAGAPGGVTQPREPLGGRRANDPQIIEGARQILGL